MLMATVSAECKVQFMMGLSLFTVKAASEPPKTNPTG